MEKAKEVVTVLLGLAGFVVLISEAGSIAGQALNTLIALGLKRDLHSLGTTG